MTNAIARICRYASVLVLARLFARMILAHPGSGIVVQREREVYFVDTGSGVWRIDAEGTMAPIQAPRFHWMALDDGGRFDDVSLPSGPAGEIARVGSDPTLLAASSFPLVIGGDGNLYHPTSASDDGLGIVRVTPSGERSIVARLPLPHLNGLAAGPDNSLYLTENDAIRRISEHGEVATIAADIGPTGCASIPSTDANDPLLRGLAVAPEGTVYVAATGCGSVVSVTPDGEVATLIQLESGPWSPTAVALSGTDVYVLEYLHTDVEDRLAWIPRVRRISPDGTSEVIASVSRS